MRSVRCAVCGVRCVVVGFCEVGERRTKDDDGGTIQPNIGQSRTHHSNTNLAVSRMCNHKTFNISAFSLFVAIHVAHAPKINYVVACFQNLVAVDGLGSLSIAFWISIVVS